MKHTMKAIFSLAALALLATASVQAQTTEKMVIALKTDDFTLAETDISSLVVGESQTIETDSGKVIDILRTADGVELYVDGELMEMNFADEGEHILIHKEVELICDSEEESSCSDKMVIISDGEDFDLQELHEMHAGDSAHKVIVIKKEVIVED